MLPSQAFSFFNTIAYQVCGDVFTLAELEHNIIRAPSGRPRSFLSKLVLPKSTFAFALGTADRRVNFAISCGSSSGLEKASAELSPTRTTTHTPTLPASHTHAHTYSHTYTPEIVASTYNSPFTRHPKSIPIPVSTGSWTDNRRPII
jgi:hypothetical protein